MPFKQHPTNPDLVVYHPNEYSVTFTRAWVGLTDEEIKKIFEADWNNPSCPEWVMEFSKRIEAKLKERNNG